LPPLTRVLSPASGHELPFPSSFVCVPACRWASPCTFMAKPPQGRPHRASTKDLHVNSTRGRPSSRNARAPTTRPIPEPESGTSSGSLVIGQRRQAGTCSYCSRRTATRGTTKQQEQQRGPGQSQGGVPKKGMPLHEATNHLELSIHCARAWLEAPLGN
jgi:hypothetical protein